MNKTHDLYSIKNEEVVGKLKIENPKNVFIGEFISLTSKAFSLKCGSDNENKLKGISKSQSEIEIEEYYISLFGGKYPKEDDTNVIRSINHDMFLQKVPKNTLSAFDEKRCCISETESTPWI